MVPLAPEISVALVNASFNGPKPWLKTVDAIAHNATQISHRHLPGAEDRLEINSLKLLFFNIVCSNYPHIRDLHWHDAALMAQPDARGKSAY